jgi:3-oxoacyl-[acyl-carrier protein] reductase
VSGDAKPLEGKVALVTGAARNLPAVIARELAAAGAAVAINDVAAERELRKVAQAIHKEGARVTVVMADVCRRNQLEEMVTQVQRDVGIVDVLVNGVGPVAPERFMELPEEKWDRIMDANLKAVYLLARLVVPGMKEKGWGRIINFSAGSADYHNASVYALAKNALRFLTRSLALELGPSITVNAISPGQIVESAPDISAYDPTLVDRAIAYTPTGRLVSRREIARMVVLLCSPAFDSVTGETIRMDGGWSIPRW